MTGKYPCSGEPDITDQYIRKKQWAMGRKEAIQKEAILEETIQKQATQNETESLAEKSGASAHGISGSTLKIIAMITMLVDHIGATVVLQALQNNPDNFDATGQARLTGIVILYYILRGIGRLSFPIFIFLLLEGFGYTHNRFAYAGRLLLFAVISEIPFDLAFNISPGWIRRGHFLEFSSQNVFFTLAIGLLVLTVVEGIRALGLDEILQMILKLGVVALGAGLAYALQTDYGAVGVIAICTSYCFRKQTKELRMAAPCVVLTLLDTSEVYAFIDAAIVHFYDGRRGLKLKWIFYMFYPLHVLILAGICVLLF